MKKHEIKEGVHDIPIEVYHNSVGYSRSSLMHLKKSPLHFWHENLNPNKEQRKVAEIVTKLDALSFGNALHTYVLEQKTFEERYVILEKVNRATKEGKEKFQNAKKKADEMNAQLICSESFEIIKKMAESINNHPEAPSFISDALYEQSIYWTDPDSEILCKVRPDIWHQNMIVDLKTTISASEKDFQKSVYNYGYHIQAAMIQEALKHSQSVNMKNFIFVAVEKEPPYAVAVYQLDETAIEMGVLDFKRMLLELKYLLKSDRWPSYPSTRISLPYYALREANND